MNQSEIHAVTHQMEPTFAGEALVCEASPVNHVVDHAVGLTNAANDATFHRRILDKFRDENRHVVAVIRQAFHENRMEDARRAAHTLKGLARLIGAHQLGESAFSVEKAMRDNSPDAEARLAALDRDLSPVLAELDAFAAADTGAEEGEGNEITEALDTLAVLIRDESDDCLEYLEEHLWLLAPYGEACSELLDCVEDGDFASAAVILADMRKQPPSA